MFISIISIELMLLLSSLWVLSELTFITGVEHQLWAQNLGQESILKESKNFLKWKIDDSK
jgi:hypothetical protein